MAGLWLSVAGGSVAGMSKETLTAAQIDELGLTDWRPLLSWLMTRFETGSFATGLELVDRIGALAEAADHHPDVTLTYPFVDVRLMSHDAGGRTQRDVDLARQISEVAAELGVSAAPASVTMVEYGLDTWDHRAVKPFWDAVLGLEPVEGAPEEVFDPTGSVSTIWFQDTDEHETPRQRWHPDVWVPPEVVPDRVAAAVAAGGTVVDDSHEQFTVLADPQGNRVCLCVMTGRSH